MDVCAGLEAGDMGAVVQVKGAIEMKRVDASGSHAGGVAGLTTACRRGKPALVIWVRAPA